MFLSIAEQAPQIPTFDILPPVEIIAAQTTRILLAQSPTPETQPPQEKVVSIGSHTITLLFDTYSYTETVNLLISAQNGLVNTQFRKMFLTPDEIARIADLNKIAKEPGNNGKIPKNLLTAEDEILITKAINMNAFAKQFTAQILKHNFSTSPKLIFTAQLNGQSVYAEITKNGNRYTVTFQKGNHESSQQKEDTKQEFKSSRVIPLRFEHIPISTYDNSIQEFDSTIQPQGLRLVRSLFVNQLVGRVEDHVETAILQVQEDIISKSESLKQPGQKLTYIIHGQFGTRAAMTVTLLENGQYTLYLTPLEERSSNLMNQEFAQNAVTNLLNPEQNQ